MTEPQRTVVLVGPTEDETLRLKSDMPGWRWVVAPEGWAGEMNRLEAVSPAGVVVYAHKENEDRAIDLCERIRGNEQLQGVPLLLAINMYQLFLGNKVRRLPNSHFIITPVATDSLEQKLSELGGMALEER